MNSDDSIKSEEMKFRLSPALKRSMKTFISLKGMEQSSFIRQAVSEFMERHLEEETAQERLERRLKTAAATRGA